MSRKDDPIALSKLGIEVWVPVVGYEGYYEVSNLGRVKSIVREPDGPRKRKAVTDIVMRQGRIGPYPCVTLWKAGKRKLRLVHHLVLEAFVGPRPKGKETRHLDGTPVNNAAFNLVWGTHKRNIRDKHTHGTAPIGTANAQAKLTDEEVIRIKRLLAKPSPPTQQSIADKFGVNQSLISMIKRGKLWAHLDA